MGKGLESALKIIRSNYGEDAVRKLGVADIGVVSTGCLSIDIILGVGGLPRGRIIEVYGVPKGGKTTVVLQTVAEAQKTMTVAYVDAEHALDEKYMEALGVDLDKLLVSQPMSGEQGIEITETLVRSGEVGLIVIDSVDALVPQAVIDGEMTDSFYAPLPRLMGQALRKLKAIARKSNTCLVFINQERSTMATQGAKKTTSGGFALKYYADVRIEVVRTGWIKNSDDEPIGQTVKVKVIASKVAPPFKECELDLIYGQGFSQETDLLNLAEKARLVVKSGAWYATADGERMGQGAAKATEWLRANPERAAAIVAAVRQAKGLDKAEVD